MIDKTCQDCKYWITNYCELLDDCDDTYVDFDFEICEFFKEVE